MIRRLLAGTAGVCLIASLMGTAIATPDADTAARGTSQRLRKAVTVKGIKRHLQVLQDIAVDNDGIRASGFPGFDASADYVASKLEAANWNVSRQQFDFVAFIPNAPAALAQVAPGQVTYTEGTDFAYMEFSGSGDVTADVTPVDVVLPPPAESGSTSGCEDDDFAGFPAGDIALIQRGTCTFGEKALNAEEAGASAALIFNEGQPGRTDLIVGTLGEPVNIPVLGLPFELGNEFAGTSGLRLHVTADTSNEMRTTENVIAETNGGDADNVVMAGAHLDSVQEGPGINDNGSGSAALVEIAEQISRLRIRPNNKLRFAWWGAEESGLVGSTHYVSQLTEEDAGRIALYLNFDMIGSPNFVRFVYDGDGSGFPDVGGGPEGSDDIERTFTRFFRNKGLATEETPFDGRSDYQGFIDVGIPAGGLFTGAEGVKTARQERVYGGVAGLAYDPCYHQACDTYFNLSEAALGQMSDAVAHAVASYARSTAKVESGAEDGGSGAFRRAAGTASYRGSRLVR